MTVSLLPGARSAPVIESLSELVNKATVARSGDKYDVFNNYLRWANEAVRQLSGRVSERDVERLVLTRRHWVLQGIDPAANDAVMSLVQLEVDERIAGLTSVRDGLTRDIARWAAHPGRLVIADTNVFLHDEHLFTSIDWRGHARARTYDSVHLVIPLLVVDELDRTKRDQDRTQARLTLRELDRMFEDPNWAVPLQESGTDDGVRVHLLMDDPHHRRLPEPDAELVDRARALGDLSGRDVTLVTYDTGMALRARTVGLTVRKLTHPPKPARASKQVSHPQPGAVQQVSGPEQA